MIFGGVGAGGSDWGGSSGAGGAMAECQMGQGVGTRGARWQLLGEVGVTWSRSSRWWAGRDQIRG